MQSGYPFVRLNFKLGAYGWHEDYYWTGKTAGNAVLLAAADTLVTRRADVLGSDAVLLNAIASNDGAWRDTKMKVYNLTRGDGKGDLLGACDPIFSSLRVLFQSGIDGKYRAVRTLGGCPASIMTGVPGPTVTPEWVKVWHRLEQLLSSKLPLLSGWGFKVLDRTNGIGDRRPNTFIVSGAGGTTITCPGHSLAVGDQVRIDHMETADDDPLNGVWTVVAPVVAGASYSIGYKNLGGVVLLNGGFSRRQGAIVVPITDVQLDGISSHKRGVPYGQRKGRRRVR